MLKGNSVDLRRPRNHRKDTLYPLHNAYVGLLQLSYGRCYPIFTPPAVAEPRSVLMMSFTMTRPFPQPGSFLSSMDFILVPRRLARRFRLRHSPLREACLYYLRSAMRSAIALFLVSTRSLLITIPSAVITALLMFVRLGSVPSKCGYVTFGLVL